MAKESVNYWVTMTDKFMSGWGGAEGKTSKYIVECETLEEAEIVEENAHNRDEMKYVNLCYKKPYYPPGKYHTAMVSKEEAPRWFTKGGFKK